MKNGYLRIDVSTARPEQLVARLLERAVTSIRRARGDNGEVEPLDRTRAVSKALDIVSELRGSLDLERGGDIAHNLDALYEFINHRLLIASIEHDDQPLDDALRPLEIISDAWHELCAQTEAGTAA